MRRNIVAIALIALTLVFSGCINKEDSTPSTTVPAKVTTISQTVPTSACDAMKDGNEKNLCIKNAALQANSARACNKLRAKDVRIDCFTELAQQRNDARVCSYLDNLPAGLGKCQASFAIAKKNVRVCLGLKDALAKSSCVTVFAASKNSSKTCQYIPEADVDGRSMCFTGVAVSLNSPRLCLLTSEGANRNKCFAAISASRNSARTCLYIADTDVAGRNDCFQAVAIAKKDRRECGRIADSGAQRNCLIAVRRAL